MGLWGLGDTDFPAESAQITLAEVRAQSASDADARGGQSSSAIQMGDTAVIDSDPGDACESEPLQPSLRLMRCQAIAERLLSVAKTRESPPLPGPFRPPAA
jgi:hypothetical protein